VAVAVAVAALQLAGGVPAERECCHTGARHVTCHDLPRCPPQVTSRLGWQVAAASLCASPVGYSVSLFLWAGLATSYIGAATLPASSHASR
jgi:hypothetical protein